MDPKISINLFDFFSIFPIYMKFFSPGPRHGCALRVRGGVHDHLQAGRRPAPGPARAADDPADGRAAQGGQAGPVPDPVRGAGHQLLRGVRFFPIFLCIRISYRNSQNFLLFF